MYFLNIEDLLNSTINPKHPEHSCTVIDVNLGVLSYCEYKTGKDLWAIKGNVLIIHNRPVRPWLCFGATNSSLVSPDSPGIETEWSGITNVIRALDFMV